MAEIHVEEHSSPIKTPGQLIAVVVLSFLIPITIIGMLAHLVTSGGDYGKGNSAMTDEEVAKRLKPVGEVVVADASKPQAARSGKEVVDAVCGACHLTGALNAPKVGDAAAWGKLIKQGPASLLANAIKGVRQMPPRGGSPDISDLELARAIAFMANQAGANWKEPDAAPAAAAKPAPGAKADAKPAPKGK